MPIYEFQCTVCGHKLERLCKQGDCGEGLTCPHCHGQTFKRMLSGFAAPGTRGGKDKCSGCKGGNCSSC